MTNTDDIFYIYQHQYDIIMHHVIDTFPEEAGGFLAGEGGVIKGVLPTYNKSPHSRKSRFSITSEDIQRAHEFCAKYSLEYYGVYHSHPKGSAKPSKEDLINVQKYMFIVGLKDLDNPEFTAYKTHGYHIERIPISILDNKGIKVLSLDKQQSYIDPFSLESEMTRLHNMITKIKKNKKVNYRKYPSQKPENTNGFSTLA